MDGSVKEKLFTMLGSTFSSELNWSSYICIAKTASKIGNLICSMKFLSPAVALYLHESSHAWNTVVMSGLVLLVATWN